MFVFFAHQGRIYSKKIFPEVNILLVGVSKITLGKAQIIDGVKYVCFPYPVVAYDTVYFSRELKFALCMVLELYKCKFGQEHYI